MKKDDKKKKSQKEMRPTKARAKMTAGATKQKTVKVPAQQEAPAVVASAHVVFLKLEVGCAASLYFFKDIFAYFGWKVTFEDSTKILVTDDIITIAIFHGSNISGSGIYVIDVGCNTFFLEVDSKEAVDKFEQEFLIPNRIPVRRGETEKYQKKEEEGNYSIFFDTPDRLTVGIISK